MCVCRGRGDRHQVWLNAADERVEMSKDTDIEQDAAEKSSDEERFTKDWLISNALTAFLGALMLERELNRLVLVVVEVTIPTYVWTTIFTVIAALFTLSIILAVSSLIPPLRRLAVSIGRRFSLILGILTLSSFILSWSSTVSTLPYDDWWSLFVILGGLLLILLITLKLFRKI